MTFRIQISWQGEVSAFILSGRINEVDLNEVNLIDLEGVRFLVGCEGNGTARERIEKERPQG